MGYSWWWPAFKYGQKVLRSRAIRGSRMAPRRFYHRRGRNYYRVDPMGQIREKYSYPSYWARRGIKPPLIYGPIAYDTYGRFRRRRSNSGYRGRYQNRNYYNNYHRY